MYCSRKLYFAFKIFIRLQCLTITKGIAIPFCNLIIRNMYVRRGLECSYACGKWQTKCNNRSYLFSKHRIYILTLYGFSYRKRRNRIMIVDANNLVQILLQTRIAKYIFYIYYNTITIYI